MKIPLLFFAAAAAFSLGAADFDLGNYIRSRCRAGEREIVLPDGELRCRGTVELGREFRDLTIRGGRNTTLVCTNLVDLFYLNGCSRVTMRDFTVDYDPLPFTQGTITAIDRAKKVIRYRLHAGYPRLEKRYLVHHPLFFGKQTRTMKYDRIWSHCRDNRMLSPEEGELQMEQIQPNLEVGDFVVLNYRPGCIMKIRGMSDSLKFENLTFYSSPGGGIFARRTRGRHEIRNCRMVRGPRPAGASEERLLSLSADGINYATSRQGPLIEGNEIAFIGDDSVNLHGSPLRVVRREKESFLAVVGYRPTEYTELIQPGDEMRLLAKENFAVLGTARVRKVEIAEDLPGLDRKLFGLAQPPPEYITYRITVDGPLPEPGTLVDFPAINSPGFLIRNNYFHDHRARGLRIMAYRGLIENNRIERLENAAISIGPEYAYWQEGGWVNGVTVRGNRIEAVGLNGSAYSRFGYSLGAICTFVRNEGRAVFYPGNRNVRIEDNLIRNCTLAGIYLLASDGATVRGNTIIDVNRGTAPGIGGNYGIRYEAVPIGTFCAENSTIHDNEVKP